MWKQFFELVRQVFLLTDDTQKNKAAIKEQQKEFKEFSERLDREIREPRTAIERLAFEIQRNSERERHERELWALKIETQLLRAKHELPPTTEPNNPPTT